MHELKRTSIRALREASTCESFVNQAETVGRGLANGGRRPEV